MTDIKDYQMWKLDENSKTIVSKFNNGIIGIDGNSVFSAYTGDGDMVGAVSVDQTTSSNYSFKLTGIYDQISFNFNIGQIPTLPFLQNALISQNRHPVVSL